MLVPLYYFGFTGKSMPHPVQQLVYAAACEAFSSMEKARSFATEVAEGIVYTDFETRRIVTLTGIEFRATVHFSGGTTKARFVIPRHAIEEFAQTRVIRGAGIGASPMDGVPEDLVEELLDGPGGKQAVH